MATGLFSSASPQEMEQALLDQSAAASAALTPDQRIGALAYKAGAGLTKGLGESLGVDMQDPIMKRATRARQIAEKYPTDTAEGLMAFARDPELRANDPEMASKAMTQAQAMQTQAAALGKTQADSRKAASEAASKEFELSSAGRADKLAQSGKFTSPSIANFIAGKGDLEAIDKFTKPTADFIAKANELGFGDKPRYGDYSAPQTGLVNSALLKETLSKNEKLAPRTSIDLGGNKYAEGVGGGLADADVAKYAVAQTIPAALKKVGETLNILQNSDINTGIGADLFTSLDRARAQFASDKKAGVRVSNTEYLTALFGSEVFPLIQTLGIGSKGMDTPAEKQFLLDVMTGRVSLSKDTLIRMTKDRQTALRNTASQYNENVNSGEFDKFFAVSGRRKMTIPVEEASKKPAPGAMNEAAYQAYKRAQEGGG
jgi:hypothetical protein